MIARLAFRLGMKGMSRYHASDDLLARSVACEWSVVLDTILRLGRGFDLNHRPWNHSLGANTGLLVDTDGGRNVNCASANPIPVTASPSSRVRTRFAPCAESKRPF